METAKYISAIKFHGGIDEDSYLYDLPIIKYLHKKRELPFLSNVTFFVGENGTGKSTLLEAIAVAYGFNAEGGTRNYRFSTNETHSELWEHIALVKNDYAERGFFLRAESLYNTATYMEQLGLGLLHDQSHGESFLSVIQDFRGNGLYVLDEPEAALSPMRQLTLLVEMDTLIKEGAQFIIATHSPILMAFPGAQILEFSNKGIQSVQYQDTEHYRVTKQFLDNPEKMLHYLLR
jgi:predicted ATPase